MLAGPLLLVLDAGPGESVPEPGRWVQAVLAAWPGGSPRPQSATAEQVRRNPALRQGSSMVWIAATDLSKGQTAELAATMSEHRRSVVVTLPGGDDDNALLDDSVAVVRLGSEPEAAAAVLAAVASQSGLIREMADEIRLLSAHRGGLSAQVSKLDEELRLAAQIQREFLPRNLPVINGVSFHALWRPAGYVSGDLYDVEQLDENHVGFFIADAVGHGVPAALMTVYIKRSLQTKVIDPSLPGGYRLLEPGESLARLNADMVRHQQGKVRFCTAAYGVINTQTREVAFARAGHPYPMVLHHDGSIRMLEPDGGLLGVFPDERFDTQRLTLGNGDRLLLYSDGFEMAFPEVDIASGKPQKLVSDNYTEELAELRHGHIDDALEHFKDKLDQQAGSLNQRDDLTVLCLAINAVEGEGTADAAERAAA